MQLIYVIAIGHGVRLFVRGAMVLLALMCVSAVARTARAHPCKPP
jgi:hypothetical protein